MPVSAQDIIVNPENQWRVQTPGSASWAKSPRPGDGRKKYFMITVDTHLMPPPSMFKERIEKKYVDRLPRIEVRDGVKYLVQEGLRSDRVADIAYVGEDDLRTKSSAAMPSIVDRLADQKIDGIDGEILFPNGGALLMFGSPDIDFVMAQCRVWNDWQWEYVHPHQKVSKPIACVATADVGLAVEEIKRCAKMGYEIVMIPNKPIFGPANHAHPNYNLPMFDPIWAAIQDTDMALTFHVSTGSDPRTARGNGGAVINYCVHSMAPTMEPVVNICASGVIERFPKLRFATIEANGGWVPWLLDRMDEAYHAHHFWVRPKLKNLPSDYFRSNGAASIGEDRAALLLIDEYNLENNFMWANDFPHHEGSWPHSAEAIERTMGKLTETARAKVLGLNAARIFKFEVPKD